ncbi:MAG: hypothetical protein DME53_02395, partial [Verrucomicrobia bacterium]
MRAAEEAAFGSGVQVEALMNKAGVGVAQAVTKFFAKPGLCIVFAGKGHNAGDALFAAQCLQRCGWKIEVRLAFNEADCSELMRKKLADLRRRPPEVLGGVPSNSGDVDPGVTLIGPSANVGEPTRGVQESIAAETCAGIAAPLVILD